MQMELGFFQYATGLQKNLSIQGYPINGVMVYVTQEGVENDTFITVRTPASTLVERISLDKLHQISDFQGGNANDDGAQTVGMTYIDLGLVSLADSEEMIITVDCQSSYVGAPSVIMCGVSAVIDDLPEHDELIYHYQHHTDTSFSTDSAAGVYLFKESIGSSGDIITAKMGDDTRSTTLRATNWYANLLGKIELDNLSMGVLFDNKYGQPLTINTPATNLTTIVKRIVQVDDVRRAKATQRIARTISGKYRSMDAQTKRAIP